MNHIIIYIHIYIYIYVYCWCIHNCWTKKEDTQWKNMQSGAGILSQYGLGCRFLCRSWFPMGFYLILHYLDVSLVICGFLTFVDHRVECFWLRNELFHMCLLLMYVLEPKRKICNMSICICEIYKYIAHIHIAVTRGGMAALGGALGGVGRPGLKDQRRRHRRHGRWGHPIRGQ